MAKEVSWEDAIFRVLRDAGGLMHYTEIASQIAARGLRKSPNPAANVAAVLSSSLKDESSPFLRLGRGTYTLRTSIKVGAPSIESKEEEDAPDAGEQVRFRERLGQQHAVVA